MPTTAPATAPHDNELHSAFDGNYTYDAIDRLASATRADSFDQTWTLEEIRDRVAPGGCPPGAPSDPNVRN